MKFTGLSVYIRLFSALLILIFSPGCSLNNSPDTARVTVDLGLHEKGDARGITGKDTAPAGVTGIELTVSAPDMRTVTEDIPLATGKITLNVPAGKARLFRVTAYDPTGNLGGSATKDLEAGTPADLTVAMSYQYTGVTINVNYPDGTPGSTSLTYGLNVINSGVTSNYTYTPGSPVQVGSGDARDLEVLVNTPSVTFRGTVTGQSLEAGGTAAYTVDVRLYETKILIPDKQNNRLVQVDDMTGTGWITISAGSISFGGTQFGPHDIDFDSQGRIYIANNPDICCSTGDSVVTIIDDITSTSNTPFPEIGSGYVALTIDRANNIIYHATSNALYRTDLANIATNTPMTINAGVDAILTIRGLAYADSTTIYIAGANTSGLPRIFKYNPSAENVDAVYSTGLNTPWDVVVKSTGILVSDYGGAANNKILQFDQNLQLTANYGSPVTIPATPVTDEFYGPKRFLAILNRNIYVTDEEEGTMSYARIISFDDMNGTNFTTYGSYGGAKDMFTLFSTC